MSQTDPRWLRIQELFDTATTWPKMERHARLASLEPDESLRTDVLELLEAADAERRANQQYAAQTLAPAPAPAPGAIGPFRVVRLAGAGGRGRVFQAAREVAGGEQLVAVKVMLEHLIDPRDLARFDREQRMLVALDHPSIARFIEAGWDASQGPYLAMEWIEGESLVEHCRRTGASRETRIRLVIDLLDALQAAHRSLVVHLDLKPSNVMVDRHGKVRVLDFGTARLLSEDQTGTTHQLTPRYASPEQLRGDPLTTASDLYSAALLLHELLTGGLPFRESSSFVALGERASGRVAPHVGAGEADLDAILLKALQNDPTLRYASAAEFAADLAAFLDKRPVNARRPTAWYRLSRMAARNRAAVASGVAAFVVVCGLGAYAAWQQTLRYAEALRSREIASFLRWMINTSAVPGSGRPSMTVVEMVQRGHRRLLEGTGLPSDTAAGIQADFASLTQEHGREDLAEPMARDALANADASGSPAARLKSRGTLGVIVMRRGRCAEALSLFAAGDAILQSAASSVPAAERVNYLMARATASEQCEGKLGKAIELTGQAGAVAQRLPRESFSVAPAVFRAGIQLQLALFLARAGQTKEALQAANEGLALAASHPDGRYFRVALLRIRSQVHSAAGDAQAALADLGEASRLAPGVVNPFEEMRLKTLTAGRLADAGDKPAAARLARETVAEARTRAGAIGPSFWMIVADAAEVLARCHACGEALALYREAGELTRGQMPRTWLGNRLFFEAECALPDNPARAATLAGQALAAYGELLPQHSKRRQRIAQIIAGNP